MHGIVRQSKSGGEGLFASKDLSPGDAVLEIERPLVAALDTKLLSVACSNCFLQNTDSKGGLQDSSANVVTVKACTGCRVLRYCSKRCQAESWKRHHKEECKIFRQYADKGPFSNEMRAVIQMLQLTTDTKSPFSGLESHMVDVAEEGGERYENIQILSAGMGQILGAKHPVKLIQDYFAILQMNSFTLTSSTFDPIGVALHPLAAKINHSCEPNAFVVFDGAQILVRTLKRVPKDKEIFISYVDPTLPLNRRGAELDGRYFFTCSCRRCMSDPALEDKFLKDIKTLPPKWDKDLRFRPGALEEWAKEGYKMGDCFPVDATTTILGTMQWLGFERLEHARKCQEAITNDVETIRVLRVLKEGLEACLQTKIWPEHRQPIPSLRQEVFTTLLAPTLFDGLSWSYAFMQGLRLYFTIDPVLYPETFHPVRIIHKWTMTNIAFVLADSQARSTKELKEVDFGVVIFGLMTEVQDNVRYSHGEDSNFAKAVRSKMEELMVDMTRGGGDQLQRMKDRIEEQWKILRRLASSSVVDDWMSKV